MTMYVDLDTLDIVSQGFLQRKHATYKTGIFTEEELAGINAALLVEPQTTGEVATGKAVKQGNQYIREYRDKTVEEKSREALGELAATDIKMARIGEDLVDVLVAKGVIALSDLPQAAQDIINDRKTKRSRI